MEELHLMVGARLAALVLQAPLEQQTRAAVAAVAVAQTSESITTAATVALV
jgi:hypothetical protein